MKIAIISEQNHVAIELGTCLKGSGHNVSIETRAEAAGYSLEVREGLEPASIDAIHSAILPFSPPISISRELDGEGIDARLSVGGTDSTYDAYVAGAIEDTTREVCNLLGTVSGLRIKTAEPAWTESDVVAFGPEIPPQIRHWVLFQLHRSGRAPIVTTNGVAKDALAVIMRSASDDPTKGVVVELHCDCPNATAHLVSDGLAGFKVVPGSRSPKPRFQLDLGPLCSPSLARHRLALEQATWAVIADAGIDSKVHPLKVKFVKDPDVPIPAKCVIHLPLAAWQRGEIRPMTGDIPSRFDIELRVDEPGAEAPLREALAGQGFSVAVAPGRAVASDGFSVHWGIAEKCPVQKARVTDTLRSFLDRLSLPGGYRLDEQRGDKKSPTVTIYLPIAAARGGSLPDRRGAGYRFRLISVKGPWLGRKPSQTQLLGIRPFFRRQWLRLQQSR